jgi:sulfate adenylyltransferase
MTDHLPGRFDGLPRRHPAPETLELVELVLDGALPPGYLGSPQALGLTDEATATVLDGGGLVLEDAEGTPVAAYLPHEDPALVALRPFTHGPLRRDRRTPDQVRNEAPGSRRLGVIVVGPISASEVGTIEELALEHSASPLWLVVAGAGRSGELPPGSLLRAVRTVQEESRSRGLPAAQVVPVAVPHQPDPEADRALLQCVARGYGADWVHLAEIVTDEEPHPAFARELAREHHPTHARGVTTFFTGLSGSGKSTIAKAFAERVAEDSSRTVSLLDGDEVRRLLSSGLTFSREDRDLNIRRIGYVAAEVTRHGGVAVCAPIAPFDAARREARARVEGVGDFILVHVSTPLAECERRDRKGLYAKARRGEIPDFTGISSPYEIPTDAELTIDTTGRAIDECVDEVWDLLASRGYLA